MLNRLVSLARYLDVLGPPVLGLAIYADDRGAAFAARETGEEGVACVDDVARALVLWCDLWERTHEPVARTWIDGLLGFCRWAQQADGRFLNFVLDWNGALNVEGATSRADGGCGAFVRFLPTTFKCVRRSVPSKRKDCRPCPE